MVAQTKAVATREKVATQEKAVIVWQERKITVSFNDVKKYICPKATEQEIVIFLRTCQSLGLNPWIREVYLVKYKEDEPAALIIATEAYLKAAESCSEFDGHEAGIILKDATGKLEFREGSFITDGEENKLAGGWAKVYRKDRARPFYAAVNIKECQKYTKMGTPTRFWREMPATMVRKVAMSRALREAFPTRLGGLYTAAEYEEAPEGELPPAYERNGEAYWKLWWARQKEKGLSEDDVHGILGIASLKTDWIEQGQTLEEAEDIINDFLEKTAKTKEEKPKAKRATPAKAQPVSTDMPDAAAEQAFTPPEPEAKPKRDPETIRTINELYKACHEDWGMQPNQVLKELGVSFQSDLSDTPANLYRQIAVVRA